MVTISIFLDDVEEIGALELSALDTLFLNQALSNNSTKLRIWITGDVDGQKARVAFRDGLPKLDGKKRLEVIMIQ